MDSVIRDPVNCLDRWLHSIPCCQRADPPFAGICGHLADTAFRHGHTQRLSSGHLITLSAGKLFLAFGLPHYSNGAAVSHPLPLRTESCVVAGTALRGIDTEVVGRNTSERQNSPEIVFPVDQDAPPNLPKPGSTLCCNWHPNGERLW